MNTVLFLGRLITLHGSKIEDTLIEQSLTLIQQSVNPDILYENSHFLSTIFSFANIIICWVFEHCSIGSFQSMPIIFDASGCTAMEHYLVCYNSLACWSKFCRERSTIHCIIYWLHHFTDLSANKYSIAVNFQVRKQCICIIAYTIDVSIFYEQWDIF